jgi:3-oxoacyl-[acyl-carrier protein] reductase
MDLKIADQLFVVCGATSGFGKAITMQLLREDARVIAVARGAEELSSLSMTRYGSVEAVTADLFDLQSVEAIKNQVGQRELSGILINAGGPPAAKFHETTLEMWDNAYNQILRWKVELVRALLPTFQSKNYGRIVLIESASVKQPIDNLILSNSLRMAVVGFAKSLATELAATGITINVLAPGYHETNAVNRLVKKKSEDLNINEEEAREQIVLSLPAQRMGDADDFASLATWILSPLSGYVNGQTISVDGGLIRGCFG